MNNGSTALYYKSIKIKPPGSSQSRRPPFAYRFPIEFICIFFKIQRFGLSGPPGPGGPPSFSQKNPSWNPPENASFHQRAELPGSQRSTLDFLKPHGKTAFHWCPFFAIRARKQKNVWTLDAPRKASKVS